MAEARMQTRTHNGTTEAWRPLATNFMYVMFSSLPNEKECRVGKTHTFFQISQGKTVVSVANY
jgi:hypothetical protein